MNYAVYKMGFTTALHVGNDMGSATLAAAEMTIHSDTLFSAICIEALQLGGLDALNKLYDLSKSGNLLFSDLFPYIEEEYFLPKPILQIYNNSSDKDFNKRKLHKNLKYIPADKFNSFLSYLKGAGDFDIEEVNKKISSLGKSEVRQLVSVRGLEKPQPYHVGTFSFNEERGLYLIVGYIDETDLQFLTELLESLGLSGIGGKRSAGLGKYCLDDPIYLDEPYSDGLEALANLLTEEEGTNQMLLNVALPQDNELDKAISNATYIIVRRGGFVQSDKYWDNLLKKRLIYAFGPGSCFTNMFSGDIYDVSHQGKHPVFRNLKPLFMGVKI